jgi:Lon-like ATP-dependent protease
MQIGFGEDAPRYPHILALPVVSRPLFPGIVTTIQLSDEKTIRALERLMSHPSDRIQRNTTTPPSAFAGVFLRKKSNSASVNDTTSSSTLGLIDTHPPELITDPLDLYTVGTFAQIHRITRGSISTEDSSQSLSQPNTSFSHEEGNMEQAQSHDHEDGTSTHPKASASLLLLAHRRVDLVSVDSIGPPIHCTVKHWERLKYTSTSSASEDTIRALSNEVLSIIREVATINPLFREHVTFFPSRIDPKDPYRLADFAASLTTGSPEELQAVLEERDAELRLHKALVLLSKEREVSKLQQEISKKVEEKMTETQRRYFLMEQLKSIKKELGMEKDDKEALLIKYRKKMSELDAWIQKKKKETPQSTNVETNYDEVLLAMESEIEKIGTLEKNSAEFNMTRSYLDWLTSLPWGHASTERLDIQDARTILDRDHYGLDEVKDTILQFIAVGKLKGSIQGKILCLAGPPGLTLNVSTIYCLCFF